MRRYIFVSGGVMSSVGKGIVASSISLLLKRHGFKVVPVKCENYFNVDSGTINPIEHGDPFLCEDGLEADMDLGNYERFLNQKMGKDNFVTMGQIFKTVIDRERSMGYKGEDVEAIPHVCDEIIRRIKDAGEKGKADFVVIELGGTVGEYQNVLYYEASRVMALEKGSVIHIHVSYVPIPPHIGEPKTKPTQLSIRQLMAMGIQPDIVILRSEGDVDDQRRYKLALTCNIQPKNVFSNPNVGCVYSVPLLLHKQGIDNVILELFGMKAKGIDMSDWERLAKKVKEKKGEVKISIVGKYFGTGNYSLADSYFALLEAIRHACWELNVNPVFNFINSEKREKDVEELLKGSQGIIVPIGWGARGVEGKIKAIKFAREKKIPFLGLCYGMQLACVEFARDVIGWKGAQSSEVDPKTPYPILHEIPFNKKYQVIKGDGTSMRLGAYDCVLKKGTYVYKIYENHNAFKDKKKGLVSERHRHRFEFNNKYRDEFEKNGLVISGTSPDNFFVEMIELPQSVHPFFIGTQGHPEYKSTPIEPHPLFLEFIKSSIKMKKA
ncbi:CTP synthase [Candidatus Micrarchaeota archaeon RBG_16_49_10]|nr:MAG: CTP synthase [Candidatus Micrarchaeota archaeon RBG_16_49_10]